MKDEFFQTATSREAALARLRDFAPHARRYAELRNYDVPGHPYVSRLSPAVSRRLVTEEEIVSHILAENRLVAVEKYVQEVCWRTYWKGWLEMRPAVWQEYRRRLQCGLARDENLLQTALEGKTGIGCFDHWVEELITTGYLHNHARMWFASIWIFTLRLPWELGADFFHRHLLDGDAASNTLSWRWVAGLQTPGKTYVARAENIHKFTRGRFHPRGQLQENPRARAELPDFPAPQPQSFRELPAEPPRDARRNGFLLLGDDLSPETAKLGNAQFVSVAGGWNRALRERYGFSDMVTDANRAAFADALTRAATYWNLPPSTIIKLSEENWQRDVLEWCRNQKIERVVCLHPAVGPWQEVLKELRSSLPAHVALCEVLRRWDAAFWPHATRGYFPFREKIPNTLAALGIQP